MSNTIFAGKIVFLQTIIDNSMDENFAIQLFEGKKVRIVWDAEQEIVWSVP
jgi:hypothetical protein